jgi:putative membrane protein
MKGSEIMMIDYVTLMLINMAAGLFLLGCFVWRDLDTAEDIGHWVPAFAIVGLVATVCGFVMTFTWPIPKPYSMAFGEMSVLLGVLFLGAALALAKRWGLLPLAIYAFFAGAAAILLGASIIEHSLTQQPILSGIGFILTGTAGVFAPVVVWQYEQKGLRLIGTLVLFASSAIWALTAFGAYLIHMVPAK